MNKTVEKRLVRSEVPVESTWNLDDLYVSDKAWEAALEDIQAEITKFAGFKGTLHTGPKALLE
ncbi:MAG: oligoendopeptidase F, partial [Mesobacillus sp.]